MKLIDLLAHHSRRNPERIAAICQNQSLTYQQMFDQVQSLARQLQLKGCRSGTVVTLLLNNSIEYLIAFFAASAAGATVYPLASSLTTQELSGYLARIEKSMIVTHPNQAERLSDLPVAASCLLSLDKEKLVTHFINTSALLQDFQLEGVALLAPTSGSTGQVKIAMLTDTALLRNMVSYRRTLKLTGHQNVFCVLPLHHIYSICAQILTHIGRGDTLILNARHFFIKEFVQFVQEYHITLSAFVPYLGQLLAELPRTQAHRLKSLKMITFSGSKTPVSFYRRLCTQYPDIHFINMYGMTEAGSRIALTDPQDINTPSGSVGRPLPDVELKIIDDEGHRCPVDCVGQIVLKSRGVMKGYYRQVDLTEQTLNKGWLKSGDLGSLDQQGYLTITGRKKNMIVSGGNNITPEEIEACLIAHPQVDQIAVVAQKHPRLQEVPCAFVVAQPAGRLLRSEELIRFCRGQISSYKIPHQVIFLPELPRLPSSKIDRHRLRQIAQDG